MALNGKTVVQVEIKSDGDVFHELWKAHTKFLNCPRPASKTAKVMRVKLELLARFSSGTIFMMEKTVAKTLIDIDDDKKSITFKILEGELYKTIVVHVHVETNGLNNVVTWTAEYEKLNPDVPAPDTLTEFCKNLTKDTETQHLDV